VQVELKMEMMEKVRKSIAARTKTKTKRVGREQCRKIRWI
jgi:hypothetical protein